MSGYSFQRQIDCLKNIQMTSMVGDINENICILKIVSVTCIALVGYEIQICIL